jgi:hypothetical protein
MTGFRNKKRQLISIDLSSKSADKFLCGYMFKHDTSMLNNCCYCISISKIILITRHSVQRSHWEANIQSASKEISCLLLKPVRWIQSAVTSCFFKTNLGLPIATLPFGRSTAFLIFFRVRHTRPLSYASLWSPQQQTSYILVTQCKIQLLMLQT